MPCHAATFSVGDTITTVSLIVFVGGMGMFFLLLVPMTSSRKAVLKTPLEDVPAEKSTLSGNRQLALPSMLKVVLMDVFLQKRLFDRARMRWFIHGLIFFPMALRFIWGIVALTGTLWLPQWPWVWSLIDKNNSATAMVFDVTGLMIFCGVALALTRKGFSTETRIGGLPFWDWPALVLIGAIVLVGFILEGMRMAMTGALDGPAFAFVGFAVGSLFQRTAALTEYYGYVWYLHAALMGVFLIYLPFSRLRHIIFSPVVLALNAVTGRK